MGPIMVLLDKLDFIAAGVFCIILLMINSFLRKVANGKLRMVMRLCLYIPFVMLGTYLVPDKQLTYFNYGFSFNHSELKINTDDYFIASAITSFAYLIFFWYEIKRFHKAKNTDKAGNTSEVVSSVIFFYIVNLASLALVAGGYNYNFVLSQGVIAAVLACLFCLLEYMKFKRNNPTDRTFILKSPTHVYSKELEIFYRAEDNSIHIRRTQQPKEENVLSYAGMIPYFYKDDNSEYQFNLSVSSGETSYRVWEPHVLHVSGKKSHSYINGESVTTYEEGQTITDYNKGEYVNKKDGTYFVNLSVVIDNKKHDLSLKNVSKAKAQAIMDVIKNINQKYSSKRDELNQRVDAQKQQILQQENQVKEQRDADIKSQVQLAVNELLTQAQINTADDYFIDFVYDKDSGRIQFLLVADRQGHGAIVTEDGNDVWIGNWKGAEAMFDQEKDAMQIKVVDQAYRQHFMKERRLAVTGISPEKYEEWQDRIALLNEMLSAS